MRCLACDGTGVEMLAPWVDHSDAPCRACNATGVASNDEYEKKLREAVAKIGMVYVIRDDVNKRIKIGTALNPLTRLRNLQTGSSTPLRLMAMFPGGRQGEREFQKIWPDRRLAGEWFDDSDRAISKIIVYTSRTGGGIAWPQR